MRIILTNHARMRSEVRGVSFEQIVECITNPDIVSQETDGKLCYKKLQDQKTSLLLCYVVGDDGTVKVITIIKTSKITKYFK